MHLEQYLLSLYRKAFDQQVSSLSPSSKDEQLKSPVSTPRGRTLEFSKSDIKPKTENSTIYTSCQSFPNSWNESNNLGGEEKLLDSGVQRCHSSLSQCSALSTRNSPPVELLGKAVRACHSQPLSMMEVTHTSSYNALPFPVYIFQYFAEKDVRGYDRVRLPF